MADTAHTRTDWLALIGKLTAVAINLFRKEGLSSDRDSESVMKGLGKSPMDFAKAALIELFARKDRYPTTTDDELFAVAVTILKRDFLDAVKNHAYKTTRNVTPEVLQQVIAEDSTNPLTEIDAEELAKRFYRYTAGDQDLIDIIDAAAYLSVNQSEQFTRADIADLLSITPEEVTKRNNRLKRKFHADDGRSADG